MLDSCGSKGTGKWTVKEAAEQGVPAGTIAAALEARYLSSLKATRGALAARGIALRTCPAYSIEAVATLVMTHVLAFSASIYEQRRRLQAGDRRHFEDMDANIGTMPHFELAGKTLGLVGGNGAIGTRVGQLALAFGMRVLVSTRSGRCPAGCEVASLGATRWRL